MAEEESTTLSSDGLLDEVNEKKTGISKNVGITLWKNAWNKILVNQDTFGDFCFYNLLSTVIDSMNFDRGLNKDEDVRCHFLFISETATGKDEGVDLVKLVFTNLNLLIASGIITELNKFYYMSENDVTDASLVGSIDDLKVSYNRKKGLYSGAQGYQDIVKKGILSYAHHLSATEAKSFFEKKEHAIKVQTHVREATNQKRRVSKGLSQAHNIHFQAKTTFLLCTQPNYIDLLGLIHNGTVGRFFPYEKELTKEFHNDVLDAIGHDSFKTECVAVNKIKNSTQLKEFVEYIENVIKWYHNNFNRIKLEDELDIYALNKTKEINNEITKDMQKIDEYLLNGFIRLCFKNFRKLVKLNTISLKETLITKSNVDNVLHLYEHSILTVKNFLMKSTDINKAYYCLVDIFQKYPNGISAETLYKEVNNALGIQRSSSYKLVRRFYNDKILKSTSSGKNIIYSMNSNDKEQKNGN